MFIFEHPERVIVVSIGMMLFGCIMPFLMAMQVVESTIFLNFLSFGLSTLGLLRSALRGREWPGARRTTRRLHRRRLAP